MSFAAVSTQSIMMKQKTLESLLLMIHEAIVN